MPRSDSPRPDFFHVGVFKGGSTALYEALRRHPQIFMPFHKEPLFFGRDLTARYGRRTFDARPACDDFGPSAWRRGSKDDRSDHIVLKRVRR